MTPSNQHSDEARTKNREPWYFSNDNGDETWYITDGVETFPIHLASPVEFGLALQGTVDRGRESKQHTDRETLARIMADAILAAPSLSLVAARRNFAEKASAHMRANGHGFTRRIDMELLYDALFASGILKPSSEVEAAALEAAADIAEHPTWQSKPILNDVEHAVVVKIATALRGRAARVRSGKGEA